MTCTGNANSASSRDVTAAPHAAAKWTAAEMGAEYVRLGMEKTSEPGHRHSTALELSQGPEWDRFMGALAQHDAHCPADGIPGVYTAAAGRNWIARMHIETHRAFEGVCPSLTVSDHHHDKKICADVLSHRSVQSPCIVYSLGSRNEFSFENGIRSFGCSIHTFDCTIEPEAVLPPNVTFHKWCLSAKRDNAINSSLYLTLPEIMKRLGHTHVDMLKIDVENYEFNVLTDLAAGTVSQISVETHLQSTEAWRMTGHNRKTSPGCTKKMWGDTFGHLADVGFKIVSMDPQISCACCMEWTLVDAKFL